MQIPPFWMVLAVVPDLLLEGVGRENFGVAVNRLALLVLLPSFAGGLQFQVQRAKGVTYGSRGELRI